jgi:hypothetical protein
MHYCYLSADQTASEPFSISPFPQPDFFGGKESRSLGIGLVLKGLITKCKQIKSMECGRYSGNQNGQKHRKIFGFGPLSPKIRKSPKIKKCELFLPKSPQNGQTTRDQKKLITKGKSPD